MKQKFLIVICALMFCIGAKAVCVTIDGLVYEIYVKQNYAELVDGKGSNNAYAYIPSKVTYKDATYPVTKIGARCFQSCYNLEKVRIPSTVTSIGNHCFKDCYNLKSVNMRPLLLLLWVITVLMGVAIWSLSAYLRLSHI